MPLTRAAIDEFKKKLDEDGFTEATIDILLQNDFCSIESLKLLASEPASLDELKLSMQQRLLLKKFVIRGAEPSPVISVDNGGQVGGLAQVLHDLTGGESTPHAHADPQVYINKGSYSKVNFYDILDFINAIPPLQEKCVMESDGIEMLVRNVGNKRPKLEDVSIEEWALGNVRIMHELYAAGKLNSACSLKDYMSYTAKICELFRAFDRSSVLQYDREYRHLQACHHFRWGCDVPHLHTVHLRLKPVPEASSTAQRPARVPICKLYNSEAGCHYRKCKYSHVCNQPGCFKPHPRYVGHAVQDEPKVRAGRAASIPPVSHQD